MRPFCQRSYPRAAQVISAMMITTSLLLPANAQVSLNSTPVFTTEQRIAQKRHVNILLIAFRDDVSQVKAQRIITRHRAKIRRKHSTKNTYETSIPTHMSLKQALSVFAAEPAVRSVRGSGLIDK